MATYTLTIANWHPAKVNQLYDGHWAKRARLKKADQATVAWCAREAGVPGATGKRRVGLHIVLGPRQRAGDCDAYFKSLLDSLTACGLLTDDNRQGVELTQPTFSRGERKATVITLEDVEANP